MKIALISLIFLGIIFSCSAQQFSQKFQAKPGKRETAELKEGDYVCKFEFQVEGGTGEEWEMQMEIGADDVTCMIGRPGPASYLYFKDFAASMGGRKLKRFSIDDQSGRQLVHGTHFEIKEGNIAVPTKGFEKQIALLIMETSKETTAPKSGKTKSTKKAASKKEL